LTLRFSVKYSSGKLRPDDEMFEIRRINPKGHISDKYVGNLGRLIQWVDVVNKVFDVNLLDPLHQTYGDVTWKDKKDINFEHVSDCKEGNLKELFYTGIPERPKSGQCVLEVSESFMRSVVALCTNNEPFSDTTPEFKNELSEWARRGSAEQEKFNPSPLLDQGKEKPVIGFNFEHGKVHFFEGKLGESLATKPLVMGKAPLPEYSAGEVHVQASPAVLSLFFDMGATQGNGHSTSYNHFKYWARLVTQPKVNSRLVGDNMNRVWNDYVDADSPQQGCLGTALGKLDAYYKMNDDPYVLYPYEKKIIDEATDERTRSAPAIVPVHQKGLPGTTDSESVAHILSLESVERLWKSFFRVSIDDCFTFDEEWEGVSKYHKAVLLLGKFIEKVNLTFNGLASLDDFERLYFHLLSLNLDLPFQHCFPRNHTMMIYELMVLFLSSHNVRTASVDSMSRILSTRYALLWRKPEETWQQCYDELGKRRFVGLTVNYSSVSASATAKVIFCSTKRHTRKEANGRIPSIFYRDLNDMLVLHSALIQRNRASQDTRGILDFVINQIRSAYAGTAKPTVPPEVEDFSVHPSQANKNWLAKKLRPVIKNLISICESGDSHQITKLCGSEFSKLPLDEATKRILDRISIGKERTPYRHSLERLGKLSQKVDFICILCTQYTYNFGFDSSQAPVTNFFSTNGLPVSALRDGIIHHYEGRVIRFDMTDQPRNSAHKLSKLDCRRDDYKLMKVRRTFCGEVNYCATFVRLVMFLSHGSYKVESGC